MRAYHLKQRKRGNILSPPYDSTIHKRRSLRLPTYDYSSNGAYFVTICTYENQSLLARELRHILEDTWKTLPQRFPDLVLDDFIIMPDHVHFILWINANTESHPTLGDIVGAYKSLTGRASLAVMRAKQQRHSNQFWQRGYYEHIIRSEFELQQKREYIRNNPIKEALRHNKL